jgi:hypothetical protein
MLRRARVEARAVETMGKIPFEFRFEKILDRFT